MPPHAPASVPQPPAPPREQPIPRRLSFRRSLRESGLPEDYLDALDAKRRQLDDSIWKYIASKEREYKTYEKELRHQRRASQGQDGDAVTTGNGNGGRKRRSAGEEGVPEGSKAVSAKVDGVEGKGAKDRDREARETMDRSSITGLKDRRASVDRDKDFVGVFTPSYLPALGDESQDATPPPLERSSSTPEQLLTGPASDLLPGAGSIERNLSDTAIHAKKPTRPSQLALQHRNSSSGSSADGRLLSAMKSPTQQQPKRKRVSLAVGDAIVAPSDNVPSSLSGHHSTPSHSRVRQGAAPERVQSFPPLQESGGSAMAGQTTSVAASLMQAEQTAVANARGYSESEQSVLSPPMVEKNDFATMPSSWPSKSKIDPDGDLFDLEGEEEGSELPPPIDDSDDDLEHAAAEEEEIPIPHRVDSPSSSTTTNPMFTPPSGERYDPTTGLIPEPSGSNPDSAVPYLPSSQVTSQMPSKPGFRRPSVVHDPVFRGSGTRYAEAEQEAVEDETYGSSFVRPATKGSFTSGSLGESFMEMNAEAMMKNREERLARTAQVRS